MDRQTERDAAGATELKALLNDLLAVVTLPAMWRGSDPSHVGRSLVDALLRILKLDLAYARLEGAAAGRAALECARTGPAALAGLPAEEIGRQLTGGLGPDPLAWPAQAGVRVGNEDITVATFKLGWQGDGVVVAGSRRADFPTAGEKLLLSVTANQAAMGLQEALTLRAQRNLAEELDRRVAERTAELAQANAGLRSEIAQRSRVEERLRREERELQRSRSLLAETQRLSATGSFSWVPGTEGIAWSDETFRIFRIPPATAITMPLVEDRIHPEDRASFRQHLQYAGSGSREVEFDCRLQLPDASMRHIHVIARGSRDEGRLECTGAIQDVTDRRRAEEALAKASSELTHVARITTMGVLAASIAHEVNQPLSGILTNASTCLRKLTSEPPETAGATLAAERLLRDGTRAAEVIRRLRALFGKRETASELVDLNDAAKEVIALSLGDLQRNRVEVRTDFAERLPPVRGDRVQLQQVLLNLVRNASDAMKRVDNRPRQLLVSTSLPGDGNVHVSVRDAGEGFGSQPPERLFQSFYTTKADGMGIGLSVSRSIIEHHKGRIGATSHEGAGATFWFDIPLSTASEVPAQPESSTA